jgi:hypothetical protein
MPLWLNLIVVLLLIWIQLVAWDRYARLFRHEAEPTDNRLHTWWSLRMSNLIILFGIGCYIYDCLHHPPLGASRLSVLLSSLTIGLGFFCRNWEG